MQNRRSRRIGQQQYLVGMASTHVRPVGGLGIGHQQHVVVSAFNFIEQHGHTAALAGTQLAVCDSRRGSEVTCHDSRVKHANPTLQ